MELSGEFTSSRDAADVSYLISAAERFARLFPDFQQLRMHDERHFTVSLAVAFGAMNGVLDLHLERTEFVPGQVVGYEGRGIAATNDIFFHLRFELQAVAEHLTLICWRGSYKVEGMFAMFAGTIIDQLGQRNLEQLITNLRENLQLSA